MKYNLEKIKASYQSKQRLDFYFFWGHQKSNSGQITKSCLSQWWEVNFEIDGVNYSTAEQFMMAEKARLFQDLDTLEMILESRSPQKAKKLGRQVKNFNEKIWNDNRSEIVVNGNLAKFSQNPELKQFLVSTGNKILVEASPYDRIWGIGMSQDHEHISNPLKWNGLNLLGFALMQVRDNL